MQQPTCHCRFSDAAALSLKACCAEGTLPVGQLARPELCPASRARPGAGSFRCRFTCNGCEDLKEMILMRHKPDFTPARGDKCPKPVVGSAYGIAALPMRCRSWQR